VTIPENEDAIHSMILDDQRISAKKTAGTLTISQEREGHIIHEILDMEKLSAKLVLKCLNAVRRVSACFTSHFGPILEGSYGIIEPSHKYD
jgi:hypothetical protein